MSHKATPLLKIERVVEDPNSGKILGKLSVKIWYVPHDSRYPSGIKYSLQFAKWTGSGFDRNYLRYDNYCGHGDHKHIRGERLPYEFVDVNTLISDFNSDAQRLLDFSLIP
ncbi:MAG: DUF6516 family protein [Desulfurobacteriaceae bacterium]